METLNPTQETSNPVDPMDKISPVPDTTNQSSQTPPVPLASDSVVQTENITVKGRSKTPLIILLSLLSVLILFVVSGALLALVAYGKVDLNNRELERKISFAIQSLPFTPKTAEYLVYQSFETQKDLKSVYLDASIAVTGSQSSEIPGLGNNFDLKIVGPIDFHDKENPEAEVNIKMSPELDADFVAKNDKIFFKINSIPAIIQGFLSGSGVSTDMFLAKWISYDLKSLESDARDVLNEDKGGRDEEQIARVKSAVLNSDVMNKIKVTETDLDGKAVYELSLNLSSEEYKKFINDISKAANPESYGNELTLNAGSQDYFENIEINTYLDKDTMYTVRSSISFRFKQNGLSVPSQVLGASTIQYFPNAYTIAANQQDDYMDVAVVINSSRYNEDFEINEPTGAVPIETIIEEYTKQMMQQYDEQAVFKLEEETSGFSEPEDEDSGISGFSE